MEPLRRAVLPILRSAVAPIRIRLGNVFASHTYSYPYGVSNPDMDEGYPGNNDHSNNMERPRHSSTDRQGNYSDEAVVTTTTTLRSADNNHNNNNHNNNNNNNNNNFNIPRNYEEAPPTNNYDAESVASESIEDVEIIQDRVSTVFDTLQAENMTAAELSLIRAIRETASDTDIMTKIVNNNSFRDFVHKYVPSVLFDQRPLLEGVGHSTRSTRNTTLVDESSDSEDEAFYVRSSTPDTASSASSSSSSSSSHSASSGYQSLEYESESELPPRRTPQEIALNRLNELCNQITPDLGLSSLSSARNTASPLPAEEYSRDIREEEPEGITSKPTMEGAGMPGVPYDSSTPQQKDISQSQPHWDVYLVMISACIIPITILAVTAALYPSHKTLGLLKSGFKAICGKIFI